MNDHINESEWVTLMTHQSDQTFNFPFEIGHWELQDLDKIRERYPQGFRIFRVIQVGSNRFEEGPFNEVFAVGGFDIYGTLYETCEQKIASGVFPFSQTSQEGIIFKLGKEKIAVFASGVQNGISEREFLSKQKVAFWSHDINNSWFGVDFGPLVSVKPNYYTLRFSHSGSNSPRNWLLQATNHPEALHRRISPTSDPEHDEYWTTLIKHKNDSSLDSSFAIHSWPIQSTEQFRIFRVIQVGPNKAGNHIFAVSGFELYGNLEVTTMYQINEHLFIYNVDREGIIQGLGALEDGQLEVYSSPLHEGTKEDILNHEEVHICTKNVKNAFVAVKFKFHSVVPTHYSFKYGSSENFYCPRNWVFQGSNDKDALKHFDTQGVWTTLSEHVNDTSLNTHFAHNTWVIPEEKRKSYTFFRILQTGPNNMDNEKWCNVLSLSGFEIFGALHEKVPSYITSFSTSSANTLTMPSNLSSFPSYSSSLFFSGFSPEIFFNQKKLTFRYSNNSNGIINELKDYLVVGSSNQLQGQPSDFISKEPLCCWTTCDDSSCPWFVVDLGITRKVIPTHYTIRSASTRNRYGPRNWLLQASNNMEIEKSLKEKLGLLTSGNMKSNTIENDLKTKSGLDVVNDPTWVTLKVHLNDRTIKTEFVDNTFRLNLPESKNEGYRFFRIIQIGPNALDEQETQNPLLKYPKHEIKDDRKNYLSVNGFELYGTLLFNSSIELYNDEEDEKLLRGLDAVPGIQKEDGIIEYLSKHPPNHSNKTSVMVYSSSIKRGKVRDFISDKQGLVVYSENEPNSWFAVDFGEKRAVIPERYAIRYANKSKFTFPTHWLFQASNKIEALSTSNPKSRLWRTLREHYNDYSLKNTFYRDRKEYPVELPDHYRKPYRFYRLIQVQENYANTNLEYSHTFSMSGFEIWGSLMEKTGTYSKKRQQAHQIISKNDMATKSVQLQHTICVQSFQAPSRIRCLEIIDDIIFVATDAPSIYSYFLNSGESTKKAFKGHTDGILWLTSSSDKKHLFSASWDTTIKIWDIDHDLCLHTFEGHRDAVTCLVVSNQLLFSCSNDGTIRIWDLVKYKSNKIIRAHSARISHMILHEKRLYSCSLDKTVKVWDYKVLTLFFLFKFFFTNELKLLFLKKRMLL